MIYRGFFDSIDHMKIYRYDVLILGSGIAGLSLALELSKTYTRIALINKNHIHDIASYKAQGGISAVVSQDDSFEDHISDTINAGANLCDLKTVECFIKQGPRAIQWLTQQGVVFDKVNKLSASYDLHREGGHTKRRVLHIRDETGKFFVRRLRENIKTNHDVDYFNDCIAIDLIVRDHTCTGCFVLNKKSQTVSMLEAKIVVLATGGASVVYSKTTNEMATGDGIAMAYRAGCRLKNMEFFQFHPTCFKTKTGVFLISEIIRGEGGSLTLPSTGERFMQRYDQRGELAPRDIVTRAMTLEMKKNHLTYVNLDISHQTDSFIKTHFPKIYNICLQNGINMTIEPIPVFPAAHYTCGGVVTDVTGQTDLKHLFAIGEVACTGLHGANRLASNSLLECVVSALNSAKKIKNLLPNIKHFKDNRGIVHYWNQRKNSAPLNEKKYIHRIRQIMWANVGIIRSNRSLINAQTELTQIKNKIESSFSTQVLTQTLIESRNLAEIACFIVQSALARKESRGTHYNTDYKFNALTPHHTYLPH